MESAKFLALVGFVCKHERWLTNKHAKFVGESSLLISAQHQQRRESDKLEGDLITEKELRKKSEQKFDSLLKLKTDTTRLEK